MSPPAASSGVVDPEPSSNNRLPPPRFPAGADSTIRTALQGDPVLKLIPSKRLPPTDSAAAALFPPFLPRDRLPVAARKYDVTDAAVTDSWDDEFRIWAHQEVEILAKEDMQLAATERDWLFGAVRSDAMERVHELLRQKSDPLNFRRIKEGVARLLNDRRMRTNFKVTMIPFDPLPQCEREIVKVPSSTRKSSPRPRDTKPEVVTLGTDDEDERQESNRGRREREGGAGEGGGGAAEVPPTATAATATGPAEPQPTPIPQRPAAQKFRVQGMDRPFAPYLVEIYLGIRDHIEDPASSLQIIKKMFPNWTASVGDEADAFIGILERAAVEEDNQGGCDDKEKTRRAACYTWFYQLGSEERRQIRFSLGPAAHSPTVSRETSPSATRVQQSTRPQVPDVATSSEEKTCRKCLTDSRSCDGQDPCAECVKRGIFHLCVYPDPPRPLAMDAAITRALSILHTKHLRNSAAVSTSDPAMSASRGGIVQKRRFSPPPPHRRQIPSPVNVSQEFIPESTSNRLLPEQPAARSRTNSFPQPARQTVALGRTRETTNSTTARARPDAHSGGPRSSSARPRQPSTDRASLDAARRTRPRLMSGPALSSPTDLRTTASRIPSPPAALQPQQFQSQSTDPRMTASVFTLPPAAPQKQRSQSHTTDLRMTASAFASPPAAPQLQRSQSQSIARFQSPAWQALLQELRPHLDVLAYCLHQYPAASTAEGGHPAISWSNSRNG